MESKKHYFRVLYGQICHLADEYLIMTQGVLNLKLYGIYDSNFPGIATVRKSYFGLLRSAASSSALEVD